MSGAPYIGRFAPSPTGPLHFGSLLAALGSYLDARHAGGQWLVRMEDLDPPREVPGSADAILRTLERYQLHWDGEVLYQSSRTPAYRKAVEELLDAGLAYRCRCSRRLVAEHPGGIYDGTCRDAAVPPTEEHAVRVRTHDDPISVADVVQGLFTQRLRTAVGDFVIRRRDGLYAYQLAVTVDDAAQDISHVVRGCDLLASTPRQSHLRHLLGLPEPCQAHLLLALAPDGQKLSKQFGAAALSMQRPAPVMFKALTLLQQDPPGELQGGSISDLLAWAISNWDIKKLKGISTIELDAQLRPVKQSQKLIAMQQPNA